MKTVVNLRHAQRRDLSDQGSSLSETGVEQARAMGARFEQFELVVTSPLPRAVETAIAMGFPGDLQEPLLKELGQAAMREPEWDTGSGYASWATAYSKQQLVYQYVQQCMPKLQSWIDRLPPDGSLLILSHGGVVETLSVALNPTADFEQLGDAPDYVEGVLAHFDEAGNCQLQQLRA